MSWWQQTAPTKPAVTLKGTGRQAGFLSSFSPGSCFQGSLYSQNLIWQLWHQLYQTCRAVFAPHSNVPLSKARWLLLDKSLRTQPQYKQPRERNPHPKSVSDYEFNSYPLLSHSSPHYFTLLRPFQWKVRSSSRFTNLSWQKTILYNSFNYCFLL